MNLKPVLWKGVVLIYILNFLKQIEISLGKNKKSIERRNTNYEKTTF